MVDASSSLCIVEHLIMELNLPISLNQHHCEKENVHVVATTSLNVLEVDSDLNMAFKKLVKGFAYVWDVLMMYDTHDLQQPPPMWVDANF